MGRRLDLPAREGQGVRVCCCTAYAATELATLAARLRGLVQEFRLS